jgi:predicted nucleic acid-binding Zn ribbon protein
VATLRSGPRLNDEGEDNVGSTVAIGSALGELIRQRGLEEALVLGQVLGCWQSIVGPEVARQVRPQVVRGDELVLVVEHPAWATELELAGPTVLARLASELGETAPRSLRVRVAPVSRR